MSIDLSFDDAQAGLASTLAQFCAEHFDGATARTSTGPFPHALWCELAELGVLAAATPEGEGGPCEIVAMMEALGRAVFPGPLAATFLATQLLPDDERIAISEGRVIPSVGRAPLFPFAPVASVFLEIAEEAVFRVQPRGAVAPVPTLGSDPWGRVDVVRIEQLEGSIRGLAIYRIALAAYLVGAADGLIHAAASHAATRKQFGQTIGQFQAVAHPLAQDHICVEAARLLVRSAADQIEHDAADAHVEACAAHFSARRAAVDAAHTCHQVFGALGITLEGPVFYVSRRIMELAAMAPDPSETAEALLEGIHRVRRRGGAPA